MSNETFAMWPTKNIVLYGNDQDMRDNIIDGLKSKHQSAIITDLAFLKNPNQQDEVIIILDIDEKLDGLDYKTTLNFFDFLDSTLSHVVLTTSILPKYIKTQDDIFSRLNSYFLIKY